MTSFRILDQDPVYFDLQGNLASGGTLRFYESETTNPKDVYGDEALSINNGPEVEIGVDGRADVDIWGDGVGAYRVRLYDASDALVWQRDDVDISGAGSTLPALETGEFLTNNGSVLQWASIREVPDPTGQSGKVLGNNGTTLLWQALDVVNANTTLTVVTGGIKLSDGTNARQFVSGTDTVAASGGTTASKAIAFGVTFSAPPQVFAVINGGPGIANPSGGIPSFGVTDITTTGAVMRLDTNAFGATINITTPVPFSWFAIGSVAP